MSTQRAPRLVRARAEAAPIPEAPPVTMADVPASSMGVLSQPSALVVESSQVALDALEGVGQLPALGRADAGPQLLPERRVDGDDLFHERGGPRRAGHQPDPPVGGVGAALHQAFAFQ